MEGLLSFFQQHPVAFFIGVAALVIALAFYFSWRRRKDLEALAASLGLDYAVDGPEEYALTGTGLEIFRLGRGRKARNHIRVRGAAAEISLFDYQYTTGSGKHSQTHMLTLALIGGLRAAVPQFELKPETFIYKLGEAIGFKDIDLPNFPEFSGKYRLTGPDEAAVLAFFTPRRAAWFESHPGLRLQAAPGHVVVFRREGQLPVNSWQAFIEDVKVMAAEVLR